MSIAQEGDDLQIHLWNNNSGYMPCHRSESTHHWTALWAGLEIHLCGMIMSCFVVLVSADLCLIMTLENNAIDKHPLLNDSILKFVIFLMIY